VLCLLLGPACLLPDMPPEYSGLKSSGDLSAARALLAVGQRPLVLLWDFRLTDWGP
jgi:hypothetical protein